MESKKVRKIILADNVDGNYQDLIEFAEEVDLKDIEEAVAKVKDVYPTSYNNEDIWKALDELCSNKITCLFDVERVEY